MATQQSRSNVHLVRITLPAKGQQVPVGKELVIFGTSTDNTTSGCKVSVKVNNINPYHDALPNSGAGHTDYSEWNFTLLPTYTGIKQGQNKITAKFACNNEPALASHYSVNVTGVPISATFAPNLQYSTTIGKPGVGTKGTTTATTAAVNHVSPSKRLTVNSSSSGRY